ncbi:MAG: hypothetical protein K0S65_5032, partial [Labilithrix sp.]|nr:hypothetical protein [Labilithrix sp.]
MYAPLLAVVCFTFVTATVVAFRIFHATKRRAAADQQIAELRAEVRRWQSIVETVGPSVDITALKQAQEEKQRATQLLELATKLSRVYVWQFDFTGGQLDDARATFINVWESLGYDPPTAPTDFGSAFGLVVLPEDHGPVMKAMEACIRGETPT